MIGVVIGTGPSLADVADEVRQLKAEGKATLFGVNNTYEDFDLDVWIACDPAWHKHYGQVDGDFDKWHWDREICEQYGYHYIEGVWMVDGKAYPRSEYLTCPGETGELWTADTTRLSLNHGSAPQALNLAVHYGCDTILLVGHDMRYAPDRPRHYFNELSETEGEYPPALRKHSLFLKTDGSGMLTNYRRIAEQCNRGEIPPVINCTPGSAMPWFPFAQIADFA